MKMIVIITICVFACLANAETPRQVAYEIENDIRDDVRSAPMGSYAEMIAIKTQNRINFALNEAIKVATEELDKKDDRGAHQLAAEIRYGWFNTYGGTAFGYSYIGAHAPISSWLAKEYDSIELVLGKDFCLNSHIADIKTINYTIPVVFTPCSFSMDGIQGPRNVEYKNHFCGRSSQTTEYYHGLVPVVTYWAIYGGCTAGTSGIGFAFLCSLGAGIGEQIMSNEIAPGLSDDVYFHFCQIN